MWTACLKG